MELARSKIYLSFVVIFFILLALTLAFFLTQIGPGNPRGLYITPGNSQTEWLFAFLTVPVIVFFMGVISIFLLLPVYMGIYVKFMCARGKVGLVPIQESEGIARLLKLWGRSIILAFFILSVSYTLASQEFVIEYMSNEPIVYMGPDMLTMLQIMWIISIPCTIFIVPIWLMMDTGVVSTSKIKYTTFEGADSVTRPLYRIIKGYAGIGFAYNLFTLLGFSTIPEFIGGGASLFLLIITLISPLIVISYIFPLVIFLDFFNQRFIRRIENILSRLGSKETLHYSVGTFREVDKDQNLSSKMQ